MNELTKKTQLKDIDFRIQSISPKGMATILAYKDARYDMSRLDEAVGPLNWKKEYTSIDGRLYCGVSIYDENKKEWITKWDVGTESNTEAEKGQASDAFKRSCFNFGIGRDLYDYPRIFLQLKQNEFKSEGNRARQTWELKLNKWRWSWITAEGEPVQTICDGGKLMAVDENNKLRFDSSKDFNGAPK